MAKVKKIFSPPKVILAKDNNDLENILFLLKKGDEVIVNFSLLDLYDSYRMIYFLSGFVMAFQGKREKIEEKIYTFKL